MGFLLVDKTESSMAVLKVSKLVVLLADELVANSEFWMVEK